tara:strand:+ start:299 stop:406 length:108 start_codon:yes stop_codon:yes gene_type:complete
MFNTFFNPYLEILTRTAKKAIKKETSEIPMNVFNA